ncbi:AzlC family ABC transporter permease [Alisedimentitalea sp. MJ-SS2]|uniref:AzlC family ABC transporter permease n=1 Tax=Aliisedimentitalea sp. MJ-SS2 TaxID=3049795 RepID=UPI00290BC3E7|nr:AzlC family ABC transporter permease [Alisedimentitalea sp. MJ-SS2]MDU8928436.1 AzlC family ABC transporter permease [Alisedimentitalea sp. MJ-SS2]
MPPARVNSTFWAGVRTSAPFILVIVPFALLFGVVATEAGLTIFDTLAFSLAVIAGAAQFTALQLMQEHAPTIIVLISALAVNLRLAMYSAALTPHFGAAPLWIRALAAYTIVDQSFACATTAFDENPHWTMRQKLAFYFGTCTPLLPLFIGAVLVGGLIGKQIPPEFALDFAVPITFLAIIAPMLRTVAHLAAALVAVVLALTLAWVPFDLGLLIAGMGGMIAGARVEAQAETRIRREMAQ